MSGLTLQQWRDRLDAYMAAETRILQSQEYTVGQGGTARRNRRAELEQVQSGIKDCQQQISLLEGAAAGRARTIRLRPF